MSGVRYPDRVISLDYDSVFLFRRNKMWESLSNGDYVRRLLMASPAQPTFCSRTLWHPLHVFSQRCPENHKPDSPENHVSYTDRSWVCGQYHPFLSQHLSNLAWPQPETHTHNSCPHIHSQSFVSSVLWNSPYNDRSCFEKPPVQSWV